MHKRGRKGRVSNGLVAASCAAILAVYAAGSWRTRDAERRFEDEGGMRRPARPAPVPAAPKPVEVAAAIALPAPPEAPAAIQPAPAPVPKEPLQADPAPAPPPAVLPKKSAPASPVVAAIAVAEQPEPEPEPELAAATEAVEVAPSHPRWLDGYYTGWGTSRHGDIQAFVRIENNRIIDAGVASCETRYPCDVIRDIILQPIDLQGPDVDRVSRATESADAYYYGLVTALGHAETGTFRSTRP